jgi:tetratricopeptide (TPR) repeat protein
LGYTYRRRRRGPNWGLIVSLVLIAGAAVYFVPEYLNPRGVPPPLGSDAQPAAASAPAPAPPALDVTARMPEAADLLAAGRWNDAAGLYADIATASPGSAAAQAGWARALVYGNKPGEAVEHAQKAVDLEPRSAEYQALLALTFDWSGNIDRALTSARRATDLDPNLAEGQAELAEAYTDKFRLEDAEAALKKAVSAGGADNPEVLRVQAYLLETQADYTGAVDAYKKAIDRTPERSYLHLSLGAVLRAAKRNDEAIQAYQRAAELNPLDARAEGGLGMAYYAKEEYDTANSHLSRAVEIDPNYATAWGQLGWVFYVQKIYDKAQPNFERAVELEKDPLRNATYRHALGWVYYNTKQYAKARQAFTKALELNPDLDGARDGLQALDLVPSK